jgi:hypothetical protein
MTGQLLRERPLEHRLGHLPQQALLAQQLHPMLASLRDQRLSLLLTDQPRLISVSSRPSTSPVSNSCSIACPLSNRRRDSH